MIHTTFQLTSTLGGVIHGDVRMPRGSPPRAAIVVVHGFKGFKDWAFFPYVCTRLAAQGYAAVSFNFSHNGIGEDPETFSELEAFSRNTLTREVEELGQVVECTARGELTTDPPRKVGLLGHSRGGAVSILAAGERREIESLVTWGAIGHLDRWPEETVREWRREGVMYVLNQRTGQRLPLSFSLWEDYEENQERLDLDGTTRALNLPWLILHGREDLTVPVQEGEGLAQRSGTARLHLIDGAGHTFEAAHPFGTPAPTLEEALELSLRHFESSLGDD